MPGRSDATVCHNSARPPAASAEVSDRMRRQRSEDTKPEVELRRSCTRWGCATESIDPSSPASVDDTTSSSVPRARSSSSSDAGGTAAGSTSGRHQPTATGGRRRSTRTEHEMRTRVDVSKLTAGTSRSSGSTRTSVRPPSESQRWSGSGDCGDRLLARGGLSVNQRRPGGESRFQLGSRQLCSVRARSCVRSWTERVKGIEPSSPAWEAGALPLSYTRGNGADGIPRLTSPATSGGSRPGSPRRRGPAPMPAKEPARDPPAPRRRRVRARPR
jgi:hypothetical protein